MKRFLLFITLLFAFTITANAQPNEFTADGDGYSWEDPFNWSYMDVPLQGDDILISNGHYVYYVSGPENDFGSLEIAGGATLFAQGDIHLSGDFIVGTGSVFSTFIADSDQYSQVTCEGNYFFNGTMELDYAGHVPQIGENYQIVVGAQGSCGTATTVFVSDNSSNGFEVTLGTLCQADDLTFVVTDINYTTAILWDGEGGDGQWNNAANWDPNGIPPANSLLVFNLPGAGGYANTNGAGVTEMYNIKIGNNNTLAVNGDLLMTSNINLSAGGNLVWNGGKIYKSDPNTQSLIISDGEIVIDSPLLKELDNDMEIWVFQGDINHNQGDLNINNGKIRIFNLNNYNINGDNINIGYDSGSTHDLIITTPAKLRKTNGTGTSTINLTNLANNGDIISEVGTLVLNGTLNPGIYSEYGGSGSIQFPAGFIIDSELSPGSSPGTLTVVGNLTTSSSATFNIEIDGPNPGSEYDQILVTNSAKLEGAIDVTLGYLPANDASFEILIADNLISCDFPVQVTTSYNGTPYTFDVICSNNRLYLNGPGATLSTPNVVVDAFKIYPNPVNNVLNIKSEIPLEGSWIIYNQLGQFVLKGTLNSTETVIQTTRLETGFYALQIKDENNNTVLVKKVIAN